jgi:hypothetical protein
MTLPPPVGAYEQLTEDQQVLYNEVVELAARNRGDYAATLLAYAQVGNDPVDVEAVRRAMFGMWRPTSNNAVASLVLGLVAILVCPVPFLGIAAVLYGRSGLRETRAGIKGGQGMAVAGLVLGWINTVGWFVLGLVLVTAAIAALR